MVYVINGKSVIKTNKGIIQYINSHKDKKYIILVDNTAQARAYQKKLEIDFVRIERECNTDGSLDVQNFLDNIQNNKNILMSYNYLPYVHDELRWKLESYTLFIIDAKEPYMYYKDIFNISKYQKFNRPQPLDKSCFETDTIEGNKFCKETGRFLECALCQSKSLVKIGNTIKILNYSKLVLDSFDNSFLFTQSFDFYLKSYFEKFNIQYQYKDFK